MRIVSSLLICIFMYHGYLMIIAPEGSLLVVVILRIRIGVVVDVAMVQVIFFEVVWRRVLIPMVQHVLLFS